MQCLRCNEEINRGYYCNKCRTELFDGHKIVPLKFDKKEFYRKRRELADRMSISGVQDKISLKFGSGGELEPTATNGLYILKPIPMTEDVSRPEDIVANEHISMLLSRKVFKIPTALSALIEFSDGEKAYITRRFDYSGEERDGTLIKSDQEDFASILDRTSDTNGKNYKYESSYEACAKAIKRFVPAYMPALEDFYKRILFNYLIGNADAHLKNFSLYREAGRKDWSLTPNYDLLYTRYHIPQELGYMGLDLFDGDMETDAYRAMGYYTLEDFERFAEIIGIPERRLPKIFDAFLQKTPDVVWMVNRSFLSREGKSAYLKNYFERLKLHVCYSIENYAFRGKTQPIIEKHMPMIDALYKELQE
jgi:serine/threonine-protein kinase HipA